MLMVDVNNDGEINFQEKSSTSVVIIYYSYRAFYPSERKKD